MPGRSKSFAAITLFLVGAVSAAIGVSAQQPRIDNGRITSRPAGTAFGQSIRTLVSGQADVAWIGYAVPVVDGERTMCCFESGTAWINGTVVTRDGAACCPTCRLERSSSTSMSTRAPEPGIVKLEGSGLMTVMLRVSDRRIERVRVFSEECQLDAGGKPVAWIENVKPADSIAFLETLATDQQDRDRVTEGAVTAIALHADTAADASLERLLAPGQPDRVRRVVPFWLGNTRGRRGLEVLRRVVKEDPSTEIRKKAVFGITQSEEDAAIETLIDTARANDRAAVRGEAIFWLGQKAGRKAAAAITESIEQDPETDVKKRAVFALSQLPKDEGVPLLIGVARNHSNPAVRKQAMFWLGQSRDPRAIDFFAEILK
jgi:hypothetical protein